MTVCLSAPAGMSIPKLPRSSMLCDRDRRPAPSSSQRPRGRNRRSRAPPRVPRTHRTGSETADQFVSRSRRLAIDSRENHSRRRLTPRSSPRRAAISRANLRRQASPAAFAATEKKDGSGAIGMVRQPMDLPLRIDQAQQSQLAPGAMAVRNTDRADRREQDRRRGHASPPMPDRKRELRRASRHPNPLAYSCKQRVPSGAPSRERRSPLVTP